MFLRSVDWLFRHTLSSVPFGIALLVGIAGYIAVGSGLASVREYFELDEMGFFNALPLKLMMFLLVVTLITVTIQRIPFTPPRYGVWMVHTGIVTLIAGAAYHYNKKVEGAILIPVDGAATRFYDRWDRALYLQAGGYVTRVPLTALPRFHAYSDELKNADYLDRSELRDLSPVLAKVSQPGAQPMPAPAAEALGLKELRLAITGYWPYAEVRTRLVQDASSNDVGFIARMPAHGDDAANESVLFGAELRSRQAMWGAVEFEHRPVADQAAINAAIDASKSIHRIAIKVAGIDKTVAVQVGQPVDLAIPGYAMQIESFEPNFPAMDGTRVQLLTMMVQTPTQRFRRQVISGRDKPTDWKLGELGSGPMGKRQTEPLDPALITTYTFSDPFILLPRNGLAKHTIFTTPNESAKATVVGVSLNEPPSVQTLEGATSVLSVAHPQSGEDVLTAVMTGRTQASHADDVTLLRVDHAKAEQIADVTPKAMRNRDEGQSGRKQVVRVRAEGRDANDKPFKLEVLAPFSERPFESPWQGGLLNIPGMSTVAQVQLGNDWRRLPARIKLDKFEAEAYGGFEATSVPMLRDFRSTITITDLETGKSQTDVVFLNSPVKYDPSPLSMVFGKSWIFFQSGWDNEGQRFTVLGIGNRPGVFAMTAGCSLIIVGIFYAFYIKPLIIKRMKKNALKKAQATEHANGSGPKPKRGRAALTAR